jgi:ankyrin repeat protein
MRASPAARPLWPGPLNAPTTRSPSFCSRPGAKPDIANDYGETPLTLACANGDVSLVQKLLDAGANAKAARWNGETALMICAGNGKTDAVQQLLAHGADVAAYRPEQRPERADVGGGAGARQRGEAADQNMART